MRSNILLLPWYSIEGFFDTYRLVWNVFKTNHSKSLYAYIYKCPKWKKKCKLTTFHIMYPCLINRIKHGCKFHSKKSGLQHADPNNPTEAFVYVSLISSVIRDHSTDPNPQRHIFRKKTSNFLPLLEAIIIYHRFAHIIYHISSHEYISR